MIPLDSLLIVAITAILLYYFWPAIAKYMFEDTREDTAAMRRTVTGWEVVVRKTFEVEKFDLLTGNIEKSANQFKENIHHKIVDKAFNPLYELIEKRKQELYGECDLTVESFYNYSSVS